MLPLLYPAELTQKIQLALGTVVLIVNIGIYGWLWQTRCLDAIQVIWSILSIRPAELDRQKRPNERDQPDSRHTRGMIPDRFSFHQPYS
ncbi:MAG: hypothetical protein LZF86_140100 [Nitrospira sp.]|nr:MAG: hypothetical protein LZF86_140100 [Nitrospira sp.]